MKEGDFNLYGAGGDIIQAEAVGTYILKLPSGKVLELDNCYYMPKIIRNIVSIPLLLKQGYEIKLMGNGSFIFFSNKFYGSGCINNNLLILALNKNIFYIEKKKEDVNITYL